MAGWPASPGRPRAIPSDLTDEEWERIAPLMPKSAKRGRRRATDFRKIINAVRYLVRSGGGCRMLPIHFGPWQTVYWWFRRLARRFLFQTIHDLELMLDRGAAGREASPSAGVIDSQTVKAPAPGAMRGYDAGKKIVGRKRHIAVNTDGRLLMVNITPANISDSAGAQTILDGIRKRCPWVKHLFADGAYRAAQRARNQAITDWAKAELRRLKDAGIADSLFPLFRTWADLRFMDPAIDPSARPCPGCYRGDPAVANKTPGIGRANTLRSWLSMWSLETSKCQGGMQLAKFDLPCLVVQGVADMAVFPSDARAIHAAIDSPDKQLQMVPGAHYFEDSEVSREAAVSLMAEWMEARI